MSNQNIKNKRIECAVQSFETLSSVGLIAGDTMYMSMPLLEEVVEYYLADRDIVKLRYKIDDKIQLHKVAGLLTNAIVRIKPIVPKPELKSFSKDSEIYANEILAIYGGLAICSEHDPECNITKELWFDKWFNSFVFILHHRCYTAESLMFIYETVSRMYFPNAFLKDE